MNYPQCESSFLRKVETADQSFYLVLTDGIFFQLKGLPIDTQTDAVINNWYHSLTGDDSKFPPSDFLCRHTLQISPFLLRAAGLNLSKKRMVPLKKCQHSTVTSPPEESRPGSLFVLPNAGNTCSQAESHSAADKP